MKIDDVVLVGVIAVAGLVAAAYLVGLLIGVVQSGGLLWPILAVVVAGLAVFAVVVRQRMTSAEDDHYEKIER